MVVRRTRRWLSAVCLGLALVAGSTGLAAAAPAPVEFTEWSIRAMIEAPYVLETAISQDGRRGLVLVRYDDLSTNQRTRYLIEVDLQTGARRQLLKAEWISRIEAIPNSEDWSVLTDQGEGVQLYRISASGQTRRLVAGASTVLIGADPRRAVLMSTTEASHRFGVFDYGWAPDGRYLWYSTARVVDPLPGVDGGVKCPGTGKVKFPTSSDWLLSGASPG